MISILVYDVTNQSKLEAIKALRAVYRTLGFAQPMGLRQAKDVIDDAYVGVEREAFNEVPSQKHAEAIVAYLRVYGVEARVHEPKVEVPVTLARAIYVQLVRQGQSDLAERAFKDGAQVMGV